jgi:hypothetical protein
LANLASGLLLVITMQFDVDKPDKTTGVDGKKSLVILAKHRAADRANFA